MLSIARSRLWVINGSEEPKSQERHKTMNNAGSVSDASVMDDLSEEGRAHLAGP